MNPLSEPTYLILLALYQEEQHGYGIIKTIENLSEKTTILAPGTLYGVLKNLQKQELIQVVKVENEQRKKKTYKITEKGKQALTTEYKRFQNLIYLTTKVIPKGRVD